MKRNRQHNKANRRKDGPPGESKYARKVRKQRQAENEAPPEDWEGADRTYQAQYAHACGYHN